jgi:hypothetical protein
LRRNRAYQHECNYQRGGLWDCGYLYVSHRILIFLNSKYYSFIIEVNSGVLAAVLVFIERPARTNADSNKKMRIYSSASIAANPMLCVRALSYPVFIN